MKLKPKIRRIAKQSGFIFWDDAEWGPGKGHIDWSCEYDEELTKFAEILENKLRRKIAKQIEDIMKGDITFVWDTSEKYLQGYDDATLDAIEIVLTNGKGYGHGSEEERT
jgi:hypothetical protein